MQDMWRDEKVVRGRDLLALKDGPRPHEGPKAGAAQVGNCAFFRAFSSCDCLLPAPSSSVGTAASAV